MKPTYGTLSLLTQLSLHTRGTIHYLREYITVGHIIDIFLGVICGYF